MGQQCPIPEHGRGRPTDRSVQPRSAQPRHRCENVYPKEIEDVLTGDPAVLEAAAIGVPDDKWGEVVAAYVAPREGHAVNLEALHALCARTLAGYKRPTSITALDAIPENAVGKTDKAPLRAAHLRGTSL